MPQLEIAALKGARLEHIQQSKDFLECVKHKAAKHGVSVNPIEAYSGNSVQHIKLLAQEMDCDGIILFVRDGKGVLLNTYETKHVITAGTSKLFIIRLQAGEGRNTCKQLSKMYCIGPGGAKSKKKHF